VLLDVSGSMDDHERIVQARKAIVAVAARYARGGVFILPWENEFRDMVHIRQPEDEEEVQRQLDKEVRPGGGTNYHAAADSLIINAPTIVDKLPNAISTDVTVMFITDADTRNSTHDNPEPLNFDTVMENVKRDIGGRVHSLTLCGLNVYGASNGQVDRIFQSFRTPGLSYENWRTIRNVADIDKSIRATLGARPVKVAAKLIRADQPDVTMRVTGGDELPISLGQTLRETLTDRQHLVLAISRPAGTSPPTSVTISVSVPVQTTYTLVLTPAVRLEHQKVYVQRMFQSIRTNVIPRMSTDLRQPATGFGASDQYIDTVLHPALEAVKEEHEELRNTVNIPSEHISERWTEILHDLRNTLTSDHRRRLQQSEPAKLRMDLEAARARLRGATEAMKPRVAPAVVTATYKIRPRRPPAAVVADTTAQVEALQARLTAILERDALAAPNTGDLAAPNTGDPAAGAHRYVRHRYFNRRRRRPGSRVVDLSSYQREIGDCLICAEEKVNLYTLKCCQEKQKICGTCGVYDQVCPYCRRVAEFVPIRRRGRDGDEYSTYDKYSCQQGECVLDAVAGQYRGLNDCQRNCPVVRRPGRTTINVRKAGSDGGREDVPEAARVPPALDKGPGAHPGHPGYSGAGAAGHRRSRCSTTTHEGVSCHTCSRARLGCSRTRLGCSRARLGCSSAEQ
jgi:hypothetical protein